MLILSRAADEAVVIGEGVNEIEVTIVEVRGDKVRLGITAAPHIRIDRGEVREAVKREGRKRQ